MSKESFNPKGKLQNYNLKLRRVLETDADIIQR